MPERISVIRVEGNLAKIQLRGGHEAIVYKTDVALVAGKYWRTMQSNSGKRVVFCVEDGKTVFLHRLLVNPDQKHNVYHHNGDGLDTQHLVRAMSGIDAAGSNGTRIPRFVGFSDNRDFFYLIRRE